MANNQHGRFDAADYKKIDFSNLHPMNHRS